LLNNPEVLQAHAKVIAAQSGYEELASRQWIPDPTISIEADHHNAAAQVASEVAAAYDWRPRFAGHCRVPSMAAVATSDAA
jgi:hypothetical protein